MNDVQLNATEIDLLSSLGDKGKILDMGRSPVKAIEIAFKLIDLGLVRNDANWRLTVTSKGLEYLK